MNNSGEIKKKLSPKARKYIAWAIAAGAVAMVWSMLSNNQTNSDKNKPVEHVLTDQSTKELGMESLIAQIKIANDRLLNQEAEYRRLKKQVEDARNELTTNRSAKEETAKLKQDLETLKAKNEKEAELTNKQLRDLANENERLKKLVNQAPSITDTDNSSSSEAQTNPSPTNRNGEANAPTVQSGNDATYIDSQGNVKHYNSGIQYPRGNMQYNSESFLDTPVNVRDPYELYANNRIKPEALPSPDGAAQNSDPDAVPINSIVIAQENTSTHKKRSFKKTKPDLYLPTGSMLRGVLLSGIYAPTGVNARKDPFPVVLRIQNEAILPNLKRADLRECFLTLSGYGDMSSERALLRGETISCIANDNSVLEAKLPSYAVGEDGKAGVRGKLITRNGKTLRNAMLAGFASGIGDAFKTSAVPQLDISGSSSTTYTTAFSANTLNNGIFNGASSALNKLADYYMSMAEQTFPVVEINAGREITVTLTQGTELKTIRDPNGNTPTAASRSNVAPDEEDEDETPHDNVPKPLEK